MLEDLNFKHSPRVIVGPGDDAGVFLLDNGTALVETVDIITPPVDDPFLFGAISATNSLSDIYAMGGTPLTALAILGYDPCDFEKDTIKQILKGCLNQLSLAGVTLMGGHTVSDPEIKFGLSITGIIEKTKILTKNGAIPGDILCLTKPLGTGIAITAIKAQRLPEPHLKEVLAWMLELNDRARDMALKAKARACTDITGFGLLGHCLNMLSGSPSKIDFVIYFDKVPIMDFTRDLLESGFVPEGAYNNLNYCRDRIVTSLKEEHLLILSDPQTSGGLLFATGPENLQEIQDSGLFYSIIGEVREGCGKIYIY